MIAEDEVLRHSLAAEVATDHDRIKSQLLRRDARSLTQRCTRGKRGLAADPNIDETILVDGNDTRTRFKITLVNGWHRELMFKYMIRVSKGAFDIALLDRVMRDHVWRPGIHTQIAESLQRRSRFKFGFFRMKQGSRIGHRLLGIEDGRELLIHNFDQSQRFVGNILRFGRDSRDLISHEERAVSHENGDILASATRANVRYVNARQNSMHTSKRRCAPRIDRHDLRTCIRTAQALAIEHAR